MKKLVLLLASLAFVASANAAGIEKKGFLTTQECAEKGAFRDCSLDSFVCGKQGCFKEIEPGVLGDETLVLFVHDDGKYYHLDARNYPRSEMDEGVTRNEVGIKGEYDASTNTIIVKKFDAPPPPKKSFFKGCL